MKASTTMGKAFPSQNKIIDRGDVMATVDKMKISASDQNETLLYQTWQSVLSQPTIQQLDPSTAKLLDNIAQIGYQHADSKYEYRIDISRYLSRWSEKLQSMNAVPYEEDSYEALLDYTANSAKSFSSKSALHSVNALPTQLASSIYFRKKATVFASQSSYTKDKAGNFHAGSLEGRLMEYMKRTIPLSYAVSFAIFSSLSFIFGFYFYIGLHGGDYLIGPWTNLMLLVAAIGLAITVLVACSEWRRWQRGFQKEEQSQKASRQKKGKK